MRVHRLGVTVLTAAAIAIGVAPVARAQGTDECARLCKQDDDARKSADLVFLGDGRLIQGSTAIAPTASVKVGIVEMNPFRYEYRLEVTAIPRAAGLALDTFGPHAPTLPPWLARAPAATALGAVKDAAPAGGACSEAQKKEVEEAVAKARAALAGTTPTAAARARSFLDDAVDFESAARAETLRAGACPVVCAKAVSLRSRRDHGDLEKARTQFNEQTKALNDTLAATKNVAKGLSCRATLETEEGRLETQRDTLDQDWKKVEPNLSAAQPKLARIQQIIATGLASSSANQVFRDQVLPAEPSTVTVRVSRTDLWQDGAPDPVVTSAEASVGRSRFSFSLGLGFTGLPERRAVRSASGSGGAVVTVFAYDTEATFTPSIVGLLNASLLEGNCKLLGLCGLAVSAGVQPASDPKRLRYLAAGSFTSIDGALLISIGAAAGQIERLGGGFSPHDIVPDGLLEVPVRQEWELGWFLGLTYRVR